MKVTISFNGTKIVVPCGDGDISVRELTNLAVIRYKKAIGKPGSFWVSVSSLKSHEGGMLDPDDLIFDVCDDREQLMALFDEQPFSGHHGDGMSSSDSISDKDPVENPASPEEEVRSETAKTAPKEQGLTTGSVQAVVASINAQLSSDQQRHNFLKQRSKTSLGSSWGFDTKRQTNELRSSLRHMDSKDVQIIHTSPAPDSDDTDIQGFSSKCSLNVLRRREPLGASANKPDKKEEKRQELVPILKNSKSANNLIQPQRDSEPSFEIVIQNEIGPLGIHVVPCDEDGRLVVQGIEPGGRIDRDGRLAVGDEVIRINGYPLEETSFNKAQEIFKDALFAKELRLRVVKGQQRPEDLNASGDSNTFPAANKAHTLPKAEKLAAGTKITTAVHANNTRKIGTVMPISLTKGPLGLGFSITTRDNALGGNTPIYIKNILPKGAAIEEGTLKPGDRLLEVNEVCVDGMTQSDVVTLLRNAPQDSVVSLVVSRHLTTTTSSLKDEDKKQIQFQAESEPMQLLPSDNDKETASLEPASLPSSASPAASSDNYDEEFPWKQRQIFTFDIPVHDSERAGLGVSVKGKTNNSKNGVVDLGIFVKSVLHGGAASRDGRLKTNDQLVNINGMSLLGKANPEAMETLRKAMHDEGPIPGVISLTVARRDTSKARADAGSERRNSVSSLITSSDEDMVREYNVSNSQPATFKMPSSSQLSSLIGTRNPVVDRLMGKDSASAGVLPSNLRNDSYYIATHQETWNGTMIQMQDQQKIEEESVQSSTNTLNVGSDAEATRESLTSLVDVKPFARDMPGRQSMSEKRHATLDAKSTDTYQKRKKAREDREKTQRVEQQQRMWKKSASLESLHLQSESGPTDAEREALRTAYVRANSVRVSRNRGCNESFRAAVDRSYERDLPENGENSGFVVQDLDVSPNDENLAVNRNSDVVMRRDKSVDAKDRKGNRNSRLLTGLSNMFKGSGGVKSKSSQEVKVKMPSTSSSSTISSQTSRSAHNLSAEDRQQEYHHQHQLRAQWHQHHMKIQQIQQRQQESYLPSAAVMRPGSRVGIADMGSTSDYDVIQRLQQRPPPPPPPVNPYQHQMNMYHPGYQVYHPQQQMGIPRTHHMRTSSNLSGGSSSNSSSKPRHRPKSNYYEYDLYSSGGGVPQPQNPQEVQKMMVHPNHQQMYSLPRMQPQQYFQSDYN